MITLITGAPGAGKSAALVSMLSELSKGRPLYVSGIPDLKIPHTELEHPEKWPTEVPDGAVIVIDEVQRIWRPRGSGRAVPDDVAKLETHRHRGLDFYIVTQSPSLVDTNVRGLVGRHVHLRELGLFGRWWYEWPECCDGCRTGWRQAPIKRRYKLPKRVFGQYKSASLHVKPVRSVPRVLVVCVVSVLACGGAVWFGIDRFVGRVSGAQGVATAQHVSAAAGAVVPVRSSDAGAAASAAGPRPVDERVDFIPRISDRPWTAPAFDDLRKVQQVPHIAGGVCMGGECRCYTVGGSRLDLSPKACADWIEHPPFNPYVLPVQPPQQAQQSQPGGQGNDPMVAARRS